MTFPSCTIPRIKGLRSISRSFFCVYVFDSEQRPIRDTEETKCRVLRLMKESSFAREGSLLRYIYIKGTPISSAWLPASSPFDVAFPLASSVPSSLLHHQRSSARDGLKQVLKTSLPSALYSVVSHPRAGGSATYCYI